MIKDQTKNETNKLKNGCNSYWPHWPFQHFLTWTCSYTHTKKTWKQGKLKVAANKKQKKGNLEMPATGIAQPPTVVFRIQRGNIDQHGITLPSAFQRMR